MSIQQNIKQTYYFTTAIYVDGRIKSSVQKEWTGTVAERQEIRSTARKLSNDGTEVRVTFILKRD